MKNARTSITQLRTLPHTRRGAVLEQDVCHSPYGAGASVSLGLTPETQTPRAMEATAQSHKLYRSRGERITYLTEAAYQSRSGVSFDEKRHSSKAKAQSYYKSLYGKPGILAVALYRCVGKKKSLLSSFRSLDALGQA